MWGLEAPYWQEGLTVAGIDEVGRGALAGPVAVGAVVLPPGDYPFEDSKRLSPHARERMAREIRRVALAAAVGWASSAEVDRLGVLAATHLAAARALRRLDLVPQILITDFLRLEVEIPLLAPAKAERLSPSVAAASVLAKVCRDRLMVHLDARFPGYGFARHKGYATREHKAALARLGPTPLHRRRFAPVREVPLFADSEVAG